MILKGRGGCRIAVFVQTRGGNEMNTMALWNVRDYRRVADAIRKARRIAIFVHMFPDGDALGSMAALAMGLKRLHKDVTLFSPSVLPRRYHFLPFYGSIRLKDAGRRSFDLAIALDCASRVQLGALYEKIFRPARQTIEIDHHAFRKPFARCRLIDERAAAVGEIIYDLIRMMGIPLDRRMAVCLLVSIIVETGSFRLPTISAKTFNICADLISRGVDYYDLVEKSYWSRTSQEAKLLGICFSRIRFFKHKRLAVTYVTAADLKRLAASEEDVDPIADQIRTLKDVKVVLLFREMTGGRWRVSLRSKGRVNVGLIAEEFGGGGHPDVAGCFIGRKKIEKDRLIKRTLKEL
ncbi:MAG: bifunctional oligoribonuclease/PAP phosphatase NrnA [Candidatus Omnitrophica bacterium]|nr:bifunctional oligoribonuclease/PAP phosphatase NrnA [Candidatus Omnitrophota bacterium]MDD5574853.1 bifunctional oligoribonuclease/PAP phosphatase NrnA [Candidatus Omnitrophota bacterium]